MSLDQQFSRTQEAFLARWLHSHHARRMTKFIVAAVTLLVLGVLAVLLSFISKAASPTVWGQHHGLKVFRLT